VNEPIEDFAATVTAYQDHAAYGVYSGSAYSATGQVDAPWTVSLRHGHHADPLRLGYDTDGTLHVRTVASRRHAQYLLDAWVDARIAPEPMEVPQ